MIREDLWRKIDGGYACFHLSQIPGYNRVVSERHKKREELLWALFTQREECKNPLNEIIEEVAKKRS